MFGIGKLTALLVEAVGLIRALLKQATFNGDVLLQILKVLRLRMPGLVFLKLKSESNGMFTFSLVLPPPGASDVAKRVLAVAIGGADPTSVELAADALESADMVGELNETVEGSLMDVDSSGNESPARTFSFVISDTIAPPQPGEIAFNLKSQD